MASPRYASAFELVRDVMDWEYGNRTTVVVGANSIVSRVPQRRYVRTKIYEASILDGTGEVPAPSYCAGDSYISANPENLSPVGTGAGKWRLDHVDYGKQLSVPRSRKVAVTWVKKGAWEDITE